LSGKVLTHHYTEASLTEQAIGYWQKAGQNAIQRSAHVEAISHLRQGLALLETLPETPERTQREIDMHIALGASLIATKGWAALEVGETYTRAQHLCAPLDNPQQLFPVLRGLWSYYFTRAELQTAHALGEQLLALAHQAQDAAMLVAANRALGTTLFFMGAIASAHTHLAQGIALYDSQQHRALAFLYGEDTGVTCRCFADFTLWYLGYPDQGRVQMDEAVTLAQQVAHPFSLCFALGATALYHQFCREERCTQERADAVILLAKEQGFSYWMAFGAMLYGWALVHQGQAQEGIEQLTQGFRAFQATGAQIWRPYFLTLLAEAHGTIGEHETGLAVLTEALPLTETTGVRWYAPELYRLKGELLLQQSSDNQADAENCFQQAISIAQNQQAKSLDRH
jgi:predicted ATPase